LAKSFENTAEHATSWLELACISMVLDTWSPRQSRLPTADEAAAQTVRRAKPRVQPQSKDLGLYTPAAAS
jgi:hypothetical protein